MLKAGDRAPSFKLPSDLGKDVSFADYPGKWLVVYFYPKDHTPGCTREAQAFAASQKAFAKAGAQVLGVSKDTAKTHGSFRDKFRLNFPLLSDPDFTTHKAFGAYGEKTMYGRKVLGTIRSTFIVDPSGKVARVFPSVKVDGHAEAVLDALKELQGSAGGRTPVASKAAKPAVKPKRKPKKAPALAAKTSKRRTSTR